MRRRDQRHPPLAGQLLPESLAQRCSMADGGHARLLALRFLLPAADVRRRVAEERLRPRLGHWAARGLLWHRHQLQLDFRPLGAQSYRRAYPQVHGLERLTRGVAVKEQIRSNDTVGKKEKRDEGRVIPDGEKKASSSFYLYYMTQKTKKLYGLLFFLVPGLLSLQRVDT